MDRVVIRVQSITPGTCWVSLDDDTYIEGVDLDQGDDNRPIEVPLSIAASLPRDTGSALMSALCGQPKVAYALQQALGRTSAIPVFVRVDAGGGAGDSLPWELLFHAERAFLSLSDHYPVVRSKVVWGKRELTRELVLSRASRPEVRVLAVLAAYGADWEAELTAFEAAIAYGREKNCDLRVCVLHSATPAQIKAARAPTSGIEFIPLTDATDIWTQLELRRPNILHFFCHGSVRNGQRLECAKVLYSEVPDPANQVHLSPEDLLENLARDQHLWMVVLNACRTAEGDSSGYQNSFALRILGQKVPLVIANRVPVQDSDASVMTRSLYPPVLRKVSAAANDRIVDWANTLLPARRALVNRHRGDLTGSDSAAQKDAWSRPVFYSLPSAPTLQPVMEAEPFEAARRETRELAMEQLESAAERFPERSTGGSSHNSPTSASEPKVKYRTAPYNAGGYDADAAEHGREGRSDDDEAEATGLAMA